MTKDEAGFGSRPWLVGLEEILLHGMGLLNDDTDSSRRLALLAIDNAFELMLRTYLGLPERITKVKLPRREREEASESFPALLEAMQRHAPKRLIGVDLGAVEWFHRLRNKLYHDGNGLSIDRTQVEIYAAIARAVYRSLYGEELRPRAKGKAELLGTFVECWIRIEQGINEDAWNHSLVGRPRKVLANARYLQGAGMLTSEQRALVRQSKRIRNEVLRGLTDYRDVLTPALVSEVKDLAELFPEIGARG